MTALHLQPRIVYFGMRCGFSAPPLAALLVVGCDVRALVLPNERGSAQAPTPPQGGRDDNDPVALADAASIPLLEVANLRSPEALEAIAAYRPDLIVVACFPWRLPAVWRGIPPFGCLNVHPSLLPAGRGPEPVFWTLRRGERRTGVTIHQMDDGLDTGPIVAQTAVEVADGERAPDLERRLAVAGGHLLVDAIRDIVSGTATAVPQDLALTTTAPTPTAADYAVPTNLPARWAYNFVRGVAPLGGPLEVVVLATGERIRVRDAIDVVAGGVLGQPTVRDDTGLRAQFKPGIVRFAVASE